ncbi:MAG: hypothetical protein IJM30_11100 [Thermoguttaceae bacterium]|nr:hypothetical protein [Thermoguttaceae bacterium]
MKKYRSLFLWGALVVAFVLFGIYRRDAGLEVGAQQPAQTEQQGTDRLRDSIAAFLDNLADPKGAQKAVDDFLKNSPLGENEKTKTKIVDGLKTVNANFGNYVACESIGVKTVGTDLIVFRYLYKCENYPIVWYFTYYRPRPKNSDAPTGDWKLIGFRYDTNLDAALLDATF